MTQNRLIATDSDSVRDLDFFGLTFYLLTSAASIANDQNINDDEGIGTSQKLIALYGDRGVRWPTVTLLHPFVPRESLIGESRLTSSTMF